MVFEEKASSHLKSSSSIKQLSFHGISRRRFNSSSRSNSLPHFDTNQSGSCGESRQEKATGDWRSSSSTEMQQNAPINSRQFTTSTLSKSKSQTSSVNLIPISILDEDISSSSSEIIQRKKSSNEDDCFDDAIRPNRSPKARQNTLQKHNQSKERKSKTNVTQDTFTLNIQETRQRPLKRRSQEGVVSKAKLTQLLKTTQLEQLSKLQSKHQQECELLDDIRNFGKQRSQIEKEYGQALQKLVSQYQKKDWPTSTDAEDTDQKPVLAVWKAVLDATDKTALARITGSENYKNSIYEAAKNCRTQKDIQLKKCQELLNTLQNEITETIKELTKAKKKYFEMEQVATIARDKYQDVNDRLQKQQTSIFKSKAGLEKAFQKLQQKCDESNTNATIARNEYLLMLTVANSHQRRHYEVDMPEAMRVLDGNIFSKFQEYIGLLSRFELDACNATQEAFVASFHLSTKTSREYNTRCFLRENPIFEWGPRYEFESYGDENTSGKLTEEQPGNDNSLNREARKWTYRFERETKQLVRLSKIRESLENLMAKYSQNPDLTNDATAQETEVRLEKCKQDMRKLETSRLQGEARLLLLRETDIDVDTWIESAKAQVAKEMAESVSTPGRLSVKKKLQTPAADTPRVNGGSFIAEEDEDIFEDEFIDEFDETFDDEPLEMEKDNLSTPSSEHSRSYPITCTVSYAYQATRADELTIAVGDKIEVIEDGDLDQWVKARDRNGKQGYVPEYYLEFLASAPAVHHQYALPPGEESVQTVDSSSSTSGHDLEVSNINAAAERTPQAKKGVCLAKAIYEYEACTDEELTFPEGAIINIITKDDNGVDDGWWTGELNGKIGVFPGLVVEELGCKGNHMDSPQGAFTADEPPDFRPPPPCEHPPPPPVEPSPETMPRNPSFDGRLYQAASTLVHNDAQSELMVPEIRHERANSAPVSPVHAVTVRPHRTAPAPPKRPSSFYRANDFT